MKSVVIPERTAIAIHYPGYVESTQAALDSMGGLGGITHAHSHHDKDPLQVQCRPGWVTCAGWQLDIESLLNFGQLSAFAASWVPPLTR